MAEHNILGQKGEDVAQQYLIDKGYVLLHRDWRLGHRDLDLIMLTPDRKTLVIIEVKTRSSDGVFSPFDGMTKAKLANIRIASNAFIKQRQITLDVRFDIVAVVGNNRETMKIEHIENAFNPIFA